MIINEFTLDRSYQDNFVILQCIEHSISNLNSVEIVSAVKQIKDAILVSRYNAARLANKEMLSLYYNIGEFISVNSRNVKWGFRCDKGNF